MDAAYIQNEVKRLIDSKQIPFDVLAFGPALVEAVQGLSEDAKDFTLNVQIEDRHGRREVRMIVESPKIIEAGISEVELMLTSEGEWVFIGVHI